VPDLAGVYGVQALQSTKAVFTNGFVFDELPLQMVVAAAQAASAAGAAVCFDPGERMGLCVLAASADVAKKSP
jgi:hypothetical protein